MGGQQSNNKKRYRVSDNLGPVRWNFEDTLLIDQNDPMYDPSYHLQGEPEVYISQTPIDDHTDREDSRTTCVTVDDDKYKHHSGSLPEHENETFPQDHYDEINDLEVSETNFKRIASSRQNYHQRPYHKLPKRRNTYEQMVKIFQPLIVKNVIVRRLLPHLPFLPDPGRIRAVEEQDPRAAVIYLIDELCLNGNTEPGCWKQFIQALERCGYTHIVETLRGQETVDHTYQREYLKIITPYLRDLIYPSELLPILWAVDVISNEDKEEIGQLERNSGALAATDKLLDMVPRRHMFWYAHLVDALERVGRTDAAEILAIPEILNSNEEKDEFKMKTACKDERNRNSMALEKPDREYLEMDESAEGNGMTVPDNCKYLDYGELYTDGEGEQLDDLYLYMRNPKNHFDSTSCNTSGGLSRHTTQVNQTTQHDEEALNVKFYSSSDTVNKFPLGCSPTNCQNEFMTSYIFTDDVSSLSDHSEYYTSVNFTSERRNGRNSGTCGGNANIWSDIYKYEPPLPALTAPGTPEQQIIPENFPMEYEMDNKGRTADDISETGSVEAVKLSFPERKKRDFQKHRASQSSKNVLNKPIPTPRKRKNLRETTVPEHQSIEDVQPFCMADNGADIRVTSQTEVDVEENKKTSREGEEEKPHTSKTINDLRDTSKMAVEEIESTTIAGSKQQPNRAKVKTCTFKRKKRWRKFQRSKLTSRRRSLLIPTSLFKQKHSDGICLKLDKGQALLNRARLVTPRKIRSTISEEDEDFKSKSLPINLGKVLKTEEEISGLEEISENCKNKDEKCETQFFYSEPFRGHRGKEDEDIFTTIGQITPTKSQHSGKILNAQSSITMQRRMSETDELLDILESCNIKSIEDGCNLKRSTEIKTISRENLDPKLRENLERVRDLECKLNHLVHDGKVLDRRLQLQEDVNEILKRNRQIATKLCIKEKEAKALEAALTVDMLDPEEFVPVCSQEISTNGSLSERENSTVKIENILKATNRLTEYSTTIDTAGKDLLLENIEKDSAFYSEFTTKL